MPAVSIGERPGLLILICPMGKWSDVAVFCATATLLSVYLTCAHALLFPQPCLDLIEKRPVGIIHLLDDESNFPKGSDKSFLQKIEGQHKKHKNYLVPKTKALKFGIQHFAGDVHYQVEHFLHKNRDTVREELVAVIKQSDAPYVLTLCCCRLRKRLDAVTSCFETLGSRSGRTFSLTSPPALPSLRLML